MNINQIISEAICSLTASIRFPNSQKVGGFSDFMTNSIAYPRLHFFSTSIASLRPKDKITNYSDRVEELNPFRMMDEVFENKSSLVYTG